MKFNLPAVVSGIALCTLFTAPAFAVDFDYFKSQSCKELDDELAVMRKAETAINDSIKKKDSKANTQAVVTTLLIGWPFWGPTDHGDANNQLAEIRADIKFVVRAQKVNKCT